jgi:GNAT superfamily N-acetyltransferase
MRAVIEVAAAAFEFDISDPAVADRWGERLAHLVGTDPDGAFVAERDGRVIGVAESMRREQLWCLSMLAVAPGVQSAGAGRALLDRALAYAAGTRSGLVVSSNDPRALGLYGRSGFSLRPTFRADGAVDRCALPPAHPAIRDAGESDLEALEPIARDVRGAPYTPELRYVLGRGARIVRLADRGFAVTNPDENVWLLVARDPEAATELLWSALATVGAAARPTVQWITAEQDWAIDVVLRAGLRLTAFGALAIRGQPGRLWPFIPSPPFA